MKRVFTITALAIAFTSLPLARAIEPASAANEVKQDVLLRALVDELDRTKDKLELKDMKLPYFVEFALIDSAGSYVSATLGHVTDRRVGQNRPLRCELRIGSYKLDNTNFEGGYGGYGGYGGGTIPIEDDYTAIRQGIWWTCDRQYKTVTESFERKKAFMESKMIVDKPDDFSHAEPATHFEPRIKPEQETADLEKIAVPLSAIFREYPTVQRSSVTIGGSGSNRYLVNSEGSRIRTSDTNYSLNVSISLQASDGMQLSDSFSVEVDSLKELPTLSELTKRCKEMTDRLIELAAAPKLESYTGPVLFDAKPATQAFFWQFGGRFSGGQRPVGGETSADDFENKIDQRILPKFMNIIDDPTKTTIEGKRVRGHYEYDDQGVKAQAVSLVEKGRLKNMLMSRNPSKKYTQSNGHGRGFYGASASPACMIVTAENGKTDAELKQALIEACKDEDLPFAIRVASLGGEDGSAPLVMYKVFTDGHEEMVRGAQFARLDLKEFKKIKAAGNKPYVMNQGDSSGYTVVAPAMLFDELDLSKIDRDFDKPPIIASPVARALAQGHD